MKILKTIVFLFLIMAGASSCAQIKSWQPGGEKMANIVYLDNKANVEISFNISLNGKKWQAEQLGPLEDVMYKTSLYASIGTGDKQNLFLLQKGNSYFIIWSNTEKCYVIKRRPNPDTD